MAELPFTARTSALVLDLKRVLLTGVFVYAFFRFTWSLRQYSLGARRGLVVFAAGHRAGQRRRGVDLVPAGIPLRVIGIDAGVTAAHGGAPGQPRRHTGWRMLVMRPAV